MSCNDVFFFAPTPIRIYLAKQNTRHTDSYGTAGTNDLRGRCGFILYIGESRESASGIEMTIHYHLKC